MKSIDIDIGIDTGERAEIAKGLARVLAHTLSLCTLGALWIAGGCRTAPAPRPVSPLVPWPGASMTEGPAQQGGGQQVGAQQGGGGQGGGQQGEDAEALALKLTNPVADLISVPMLFDYDRDIGPVDGGDRYRLQLQPVVPFELNEDWNLISRTILPVVWLDDTFPGAGSQSGIGDVLQSVFFSPKQPSDGWIRGAGPVLLLPTGSDDLLTADKWGAGPTGVVLRQDGPWSYGALANHVWSFAGDDDRADVNATFLQPFLTYTTKTATTFGLVSESTFDWESDAWSVPLNLQAQQVLKIGSQLVAVGAGVRYWAESPDGGPEGFGFRLTFTLLFPN
jgi:hypothetical protein